MRNARRRTGRGGFSLLELLIVVAIIGVISAIVVPQLLGRQEEASIQTTKAGIHRLELATRLYGVQHDSAYPEGGAEVFDLLMTPCDRNNQPLPAYIEETPRDAWGEPLNYRYPPVEQTQLDLPDIWSCGPNGVDENGSGDDVNNWDDPVAADAAL